MQWKVAVPTQTEPISLTEAKLHLRVLQEDTSEDGYIQSLIIAAREYAEAVTGRALAIQTLEAYAPGFPRDGTAIPLPCPPCVSVISLSFFDNDKAEHMLTVDVDYIVVSNGDDTKIIPAVGETWSQSYPVVLVKIRYIAGYNPPQIMPRGIKQAMLLLIGHWYEHREAVTDMTSNVLPLAVRSLLYQQKVRWF